MKHCNPYTFFTISCLLIFLAFSSCDVADEATNGTGQISVHLTDAPGDFDAVHIDIESVRIKSNNFELTKNDKEGDNGWIICNDVPIRVDLLELRNGNTIQLGSEELDAGTYHQIRLVLGQDNEVVIDDETFDLKTPSAQQSGLKLNIDARIEEGKIYNLLVDFDAGRSIIKTGNGEYILKPVLRAINLKETGSISGQIEPSSVQTSVMAIANADTLSTLTENDGAFKILGVPEGSYNIIFSPTDDAYAKSSQTNVTVETKKNAQLGIISLQES